jgi:hypothetical protein
MCMNNWCDTAFASRRGRGTGASDETSLRTTHSLFIVSVFLVVLLAAAGSTQGGTVEAKSPALADVKSAIASARDGDIVRVPAGTASWTSTLVITKGITLQGATSIEGSSRDPVVKDATVVLDDIPRQRHRRPFPRQQQGASVKQVALFAGATPLRGKTGPASKPNATGIPRENQTPAIIKAKLSPEQSFRLTGFTFRSGSSKTIADDGGVHLAGTCPSARIDHCHFDQLYANPFIMTRGQIYGVVDHCVLDQSPKCECFQVYHDGWGGHNHGDGSWADATYFGTEKFLFIEDNTFRKSGPFRSGLDCFGGGRYVARFNAFNNTTTTSHGTETSGRYRGTRAVEIYKNVFNWTLLQATPGQLRSGILIQFNNLWTGNKDPRSKSMHLTCYREFRPFPFWGGANGNNRLDLNDSHGLYASGKHTGGNGSPILIVANAGWKTNQWMGYSVTNTTQRMKGRTGAVFHPSSYITRNTSETITFQGNDMGQPMTFNNGDSYEIYKLLAALDQPGRGKGDLLADKDPVVTGSWPHQALEPVYAWGNTYNNSRQLDIGSQYPTIHENRDFYNQKIPFDGTAGVGVGQLADRPKTCTPGVAYWATDQGEWDSTHDGPDGQLYVCSERNTWSLYYKPYTYPHPLISGTPASSEKTAQGKEQADKQSSSKK